MISLWKLLCLSILLAGDPCALSNRAHLVFAGFLVGGGLGDVLANRFPNAARPFIIQLSMVLGVPFILLTYKVS